MGEKIVVGYKGVASWRKWATRLSGPLACLGHSLVWATRLSNTLSQISQITKSNKSNKPNPTPTEAASPSLSAASVAGVSWKKTMQLQQSASQPVSLDWTRSEQAPRKCMPADLTCLA